jgi:hypothetical protein
VFTFDWLDGGVEFMFMFCVLIELRENLSYVVHEQLWKFFVRLEHETEELAMVVVYYVRKLFLEW